MRNEISIKIQTTNTCYEMNKDLFIAPSKVEVSENGIASIYFNAVKYGTLLLEETLQEKRVPYDKSWKECNEYYQGSEHFRVEFNGKVSLKSIINETPNDVVQLPSELLFDSCLNGKLKKLIELSPDKEIMSWKEQQRIMTQRKVSSEHLATLDACEIDKKVDDVCYGLFLLYDFKQDEDDEAVLSKFEKNATVINNQGIEIQTAFLLDNGYVYNEKNDMPLAVLTYRTACTKTQAVSIAPLHLEDN